jgi:hypothetical protein
MEKSLRRFASERKMLVMSHQAIYTFPSMRAAKNPKDPEGIFREQEDIWDFLGLKYIPPTLRWA